MIMRPRRGRLGPGMGSVTALVIGAERGLPPGELRARGMAGMGATNWVDVATGGQMTILLGKLEKLDVGLKVAIGSAVFAGLASLVALRRR